MEQAPWTLHPGGLTNGLALLCSISDNSCHAGSHVYGMDIYKLGGHYDPGGMIKNPMDGLGGDAAGPVHERFGDQGLHNVRLGVCDSAVTD